MPFDKRRKKGKIKRTQEKGEGKRITQGETNSCIYTFLCNTYISCAIPKKRDNCTGIVLRQYICVALRCARDIFLLLVGKVTRHFASSFSEEMSFARIAPQSGKVSIKAYEIGVYEKCLFAGASGVTSASCVTEEGANLVICVLTSVVRRRNVRENVVPNRGSKEVCVCFLSLEDETLLHGKTISSEISAIPLSALYFRQFI